MIWFRLPFSPWDIACVLLGHSWAIAIIPPMYGRVQAVYLLCFQWFSYVGCYIAPPGGVRQNGGVGKNCLGRGGVVRYIIYIYIYVYIPLTYHSPNPPIFNGLGGYFLAMR
jgi:hypothetical protein